MIMSTISSNITVTRRTCQTRNKQLWYAVETLVLSKEIAFTPLVPAFPLVPAEKLQEEEQIIKYLRKNKEREED